jgi:hypothetical protein
VQGLQVIEGTKEVTREVIGILGVTSTFVLWFDIVSSSL